MTSTFRTSRFELPLTGGRGVDVVTNCAGDEMLVGFDTWPALLFNQNVLGSMEPVCAERVVNVDGSLGWTNPQAIAVNRGDKSGTRIETRCPANSFARGAVSQMENVGGYIVHTGLQFVCQEAVVAPLGVVAVGAPALVEASVGAQPFNDALLCDPTRWPVGMNFGIGQILDSVQVACAQNIATLSQ